MSSKDEDKLIREEEWKIVMTKTKLGANIKPEDLRPLKVRLQEQQELKSQAWKETFTSIVSINELDAEHLKNVAEAQKMIANKIKQDDLKEIEEFKRKAVEIEEQKTQKMLHQSVYVHQKTKSKDLGTVNRQKSLLLAGIKRKFNQN